jgi:hypothetical protein
MVYLQLAQPYRDFDKIKITDISFSEQTDRSQARINVRYQIYKKQGNQYVVLFTQSLDIFNQIDVGTVAAMAPGAGFNMYDAVCKILLEYLISKNIESGSIEVE